MKTMTLTDALDSAVERMASGVDTELSAEQSTDALLPLLHVARGLFDLAAECEDVAFCARRGAEAIDWAALLADTPQHRAPSAVAGRHAAT